MRRSGGSSPMDVFMLRDRKGLLGGLTRQTPSFNPPIITVSTL